MPVRPSTTSITPAIIVHMNRPSTPYFATMPATTTTNAPVGPPICDARAAERRDEEAGDDGAVDAGLRRQAGRDRERHRERQRDEADGDAGDQVRGGRAAVVGAEAGHEARHERPGRQHETYYI